MLLYSRNIRCNLILLKPSVFLDKGNDAKTLKTSSDVYLYMYIRINLQFHVHVLVFWIDVLIHRLVLWLPNYENQHTSLLMYHPEAADLPPSIMTIDTRLPAWPREQSHGWRVLRRSCSAIVTDSGRGIYTNLWANIENLPARFPFCRRFTGEATWIDRLCSLLPRWLWPLSSYRYVFIFFHFFLRFG